MEIIRVWEDVRPRRRQRLVCSYLGFAMVVIKLLSDILTVDVTVCSGAYICVRGQEQVVLVLCPYRVHSRVCFRGYRSPATGVSVGVIRRETRDGFTKLCVVDNFDNLTALAAEITRCSVSGNTRSRMN